MGMNNITEAEVKLADEKLRAEMARLIVETQQMGVDAFFMPFLAAAVLMAATAVIVELFL